MAHIVALLAALTVGINAGPAYFNRPVQGCTHVYATLQYDVSNIAAGQYRDTDGNCYVWLNLRSYPSDLRRVCQLAVHEVGHLTGLPHSPNPRSVMYSPFNPKGPIPKPCRSLPKVN